MNKNIVSRDWNAGKIQTNGFIMLELMIAVLLTSIILTVFLTASAQMFRSYYLQAVYEELYHQGSSIDETLYVGLRFARDVTVTNNTVRFTSPTGLATGFTVQNGILFRILEDNTRQPLTGNSGMGQWQDVYIVSSQQTPFFSLQGQTVQVALLLRHRKSNQEWPCFISVVPLTAQYEKGAKNDAE
ncbi:hypothetical protein NXG27_13610 [Megasphaera paucivorans]|nr:hypothetical protein [Megasphaera paucivorans]